MNYASLRYDNTTNLGDQIQSFAAEQYLPRIDTRFDRDRLASAAADTRHLLIMNGWFSHRPETCFPPSNTIVPVFVGFHIADDAATQAHFLSPASIAYFKRYQPIGCRDRRTMEMLAERGVAAYYSKCLTLTFPSRDPKPVREKVAVVDADDVPLPRAIREQAVSLSHIVSGDPDDDIKREAARRLLDFYRDEARLVITTRLHCALPCAAMQVPVVYFGDPHDYRTSILKDIGIPIHAFKRGGFVSRTLRKLTPPRADIDWNPAPVAVTDEQQRMIDDIRTRIAERTALAPSAT